MRHVAIFILTIFMVHFPFHLGQTTAKEQKPPIKVELQQAPSTPEERTRAVGITRKLEENPFDPDAKADREWFNKWLARIPDLSVEVCSDMLGDFAKEQYKYKAEVAFQMMYGSAAYMIENPGRAQDRPAKFRAGILSALKAYEVIARLDPTGKSKSMEMLLQLQKDGQLDRFIQQNIGNCK